MTTTTLPTAKAAYERDRADRPRYQDGGARPAWEALSALAQWSWTRPARLPHQEDT